MPPCTSTTTNIDARIAQLAGPQHGVVTIDALRDAGVSRASISRRREDGRLTRLASGVYVCGQFPSDQSILLAATRSGGPGAALSHESAAREGGHWARHQDHWIHVIAQRQRRTGPVRGVKHHRSKLASFSVVESSSGIPMTSFCRTICDLGAVLTAHQIAAVLDQGRYRGDLYLDQLQTCIDERSGHRGIARVRRSLELHLQGCAGTRSRSEDRFLDLLACLPYEDPVVNTPGAAQCGGYECDFVYPRLQLIFEVDGGGHDSIGARLRDGGQDDALRVAGWTVVRIPHHRVWRDSRRLTREVGDIMAMHSR